MRKMFKFQLDEKSRMTERVAVSKFVYVEIVFVLISALRHSPSFYCLSCRNSRPANASLSTHPSRKSLQTVFSSDAGKSHQSFSWKRCGKFKSNFLQFMWTCENSKFQTFILFDTFRQRNIRRPLHFTHQVLHTPPHKFNLFLDVRHVLFVSGNHHRNLKI